MYFRKSYLSNYSKTLYGRSANGTQGTMQGTCLDLAKAINVLNKN